jgi:hypothetical protein
LITFVDSEADNGNILAMILSILFSLAILAGLLLVILYIPIRFIYYPLKFRRTATKYLAKVYEVEKKFDGSSNKYTFICNFTDNGGEMQTRRINVSRLKYNQIAPKKQSALSLSLKKNSVQSEELAYPVYVPILVGKYGKREIIKLLKGKFESEIDYDLSQY